MGSPANSTDVAARIVIAGASGTIGRAVVKECSQRGFDVFALVRSAGAGDLAELQSAQCEVVALDDTQALHDILARTAPAAVISCIASRSGAPDDARRVDYQANSNLLDAALAAGTERFVLLSAICVQKPYLAFQKAKLAFEAELAGAPIIHTIVRPTAFFKSLSGQVKRVMQGKPFLIFGDGELTRCKPISDADLARFIVGCLSDPAARGATLPVGGPGPAISLKEQGELIFEITGREPKYRSVPVRVFDIAARVLGLGARLFGGGGWFAEKAEYARIAKYYATQSMLVLNPETGEYDAEATPEYGSDTLRDHYTDLIARELPDRAAQATP